MNVQFAPARARIAAGTPCDLFFSELADNRDRVLLLDYDGTLAPFTPHREQAFPYPAVPELVRSIMRTCATRVVLISGRSAAQVAELLGLHPVPEIWGSHGIEHLHPDGCYFVAEVGAEARHAFAASVAHFSDEGVISRVEQKPGAVALHWRGLNPTEVERVKATGYRVFLPFVGRDLVLTEFDGGLELRLRGRTKGDVVRAILTEHRHDAVVSYLGDDSTDEDAFRALNGRGLTVLVRPTYRFTAAQWWVQPPGELVDFLKKWIRACGGAL